jgi:hypothetical protein
MLFDLYLGLIKVGFSLPNYHYVGFGSIFYVDFKILHKFLRMTRMTSIEGYPDLWPRCRYNLPFDTVSLFEGMSSGFMSGLDRDELYLAWLDYDFSLNEIVAGDMTAFTALARAGSMVFVTIDLEKPKELDGDSPGHFFEFYQQEMPDFSFAGMTVENFKPAVREQTIVTMAERCFTQGLRGRSNFSFEHLVRLAYADGHRMLTIGGMVADEPVRQSLAALPISELWFLSRTEGETPIEIPKFVFTQKEIAVLEQRLPTTAKVPTHTGVKQADFEAFRKFYRYWPSYSEALV